MSAELFAFLAGTVALKALAEPQSIAINHLPTAKYVSGAAPAPAKKNPDSLGIDVSARAAVVIVLRRFVQEGEQAALHDGEAFQLGLGWEINFFGRFGVVGSCGG